MEKTVGYLKYVDVVVYIIKLGGDKGVGLILSGGTIEVACLKEI